MGLPNKQMGNSEVGHMHIGAGRKIPQDLTRINEAMPMVHSHNMYFFNTTLRQLEKENKSLHIMGLFSDGGVHSHQNHLFRFLKKCVAEHFGPVYLHLF